MTAQQLLKIQIMKQYGWETIVVVPVEEHDDKFYRAEKAGQKQIMHFDLDKLFEIWSSNEEVLRTLFNIKTQQEG